MSERDGFSAAARLASFGHALRGVRETLRSQPNAWFHGLATVVVVALGLWLGVGSREWSALVLAITAVWVAELLNTALEQLCDVASPEFHPGVGRAKDAAAAGVLVAAVGATVVGLLVLGPPLLAKIG